MLHTITSLADTLIDLVKDDPVRPDIPVEFRVSEHSEIFVLLDDVYQKPQAVVCVVYKDFVPRDVIELARALEHTANTAVFYTIWSYAAGAGRQLIQAARAEIQCRRDYIKTFVTLSPPTDMARQFHLRNGAGIFSVNSDTVNYIYN
jgi:hypothetical protein